MEENNGPEMMQPSPRRPSNIHLGPMPSNTLGDQSPNLQSDPPRKHSMDPRSNANLDVDPPEPPSRTSHSEAPKDTTSDFLHGSDSTDNLMASALYGIYSPTGYDPNREDPATLWGTGTNTPMRPASVNGMKGTSVLGTSGEEKRNTRSRRRTRGSSIHLLKHRRNLKSLGLLLVNLLRRAIVLGVLGIAYGQLIIQLHDTRTIAPIRYDHINRRSPWYLVFWGGVGIFLGYLLPILDGLFGQSRPTEASKREEAVWDTIVNDRGVVEEVEHDTEDQAPGQPNNGAGWNPIVRSIGAFVGIAFAIRRLPWRSAMQVSLTFAVANPMIWYMIDRTRAGFFLSSVVGILGTCLVMALAPGWAPPSAVAIGRQASYPADPNVFGQNASAVTSAAMELEKLPGGIVSYEAVGAATWILSVLFCSCIVFGNIGRRLKSN